MARYNAWPGHRTAHKKAAKKGWARRRRAGHVSLRKRRARPSVKRRSYAKRRATRQHYAYQAIRRRARKIPMEQWYNPVKRRRKRRRNAWYDSSRRHSYAARKGWRRRKRSYRRNIGESLMIAGANPRPRRRYARRNTYTRKRYYRRNPAVFGKVQHALPLMVVGAASSIATTVAPTLTASFLGTGAWQKYASQAVMAIGGGMVVDMVFKRKGYGTIWMIVGGSIIIADVVKEYVLKGMFGLSDFGVPLAYQSFGEPEEQFEGGSSLAPAAEGSFAEAGAFPSGDRFSDLGAYVAPGQLVY